MWMVGCSNSSEVSMSDSFNGRKLRPLIPRPTSPTSPKRSSIKSAITTHPYVTCIHATDLFAFNRRLATASEETKRELEEPPLVSSRWNPTPEQLQALEDMYRRGTRTPSAEQIQQIATRLRRFGKIEGKNVFYWFQNHKARERQKRRRESTSDQEQQGDIGSLEREDFTGLRRTGFEVEETMNWAPPSNCSTLSEESVSIHRAAVVVAESRTDGWIQFEERELHQRWNTIERNATCQDKDTSCPSPHLNNAHLINTVATATEEAKAARTTDPKLLKIQNHSKLFTEDEDRETQTLELFPLRSDDFSGGINVPIKNTILDTNLIAPFKFFEFLPLKK